MRLLGIAQLTSAAQHGKTPDSVTVLGPNYIHAQIIAFKGRPYDLSRSIQHEKHWRILDSVRRRII